MPFLDKEFLDYAMTIDPTDKMCGKNGGGRIEKWILRKAFEGYLPHSILWRQKEQFSDGVVRPLSPLAFLRFVDCTYHSACAQGYSWIDSLKAVAEKKVSDAEMKAAAFRFPENTVCVLAPKVFCPLSVRRLTLLLCSAATDQRVVFVSLHL